MNENGWNRLGSYTVMLEAAYDAGLIERGDLFYYTHIDRESVPMLGMKVRAGQQIGVVGDTGEGREAGAASFRRTCTSAGTTPAPPTLART